MKSLTLTLCLLGLIACKSMPVVPTKNDITISREEPSKNCKDLGLIHGRSNSIHGNTEEAIDDMKQEAIRKGANFVHMETIGSLGTSVRGTAYYCR